MTKNTKKKYKKLMKDNPEASPNMKLEELMAKIHFKNKTKIIDITQDNILPETLTVMKAECLKEEKNLFLYHFLNAFPDESCIVFTNSISSSKRVKSFLDIAGTKSISLHAEMQ